VRTFAIRYFQGFPCVETSKRSLTLIRRSRTTRFVQRRCSL
jgi:hypothetical protein